MPETNHTANRGLPTPTSKDFVLEGPADFEALANAIDANNTGEKDYLQAGVGATGDWSFTAKMENSATCALESTAATGGAAWMGNNNIGLTRTETPAAKLKAMKPSSLPANGKYMTIGFELGSNKWGEAAIAGSPVSGTEQATQKAAEEHSPAVSLNKIRIKDVVILNTAGVYSIVSQTDRRTWVGTGAWLALTPSAKLQESSTGVPTAAARTEDGGTVTRLRGAFQVKAGQELLAKEEAFHLPLVTRPPLDDTMATFVTNNFTTFTPVYLEVEPSGAVILEGAPVKSGYTLLLSGLTFART